MSSRRAGQTRTRSRRKTGLRWRVRACPTARWSVANPLKNAPERHGVAQSRHREGCSQDRPERADDDERRDGARGGGAPRSRRRRRPPAGATRRRALREVSVHHRGLGQPVHEGQDAGAEQNRAADVPAGIFTSPATSVTSDQPSKREEQDHDRGRAIAAGGTARSIDDAGVSRGAGVSSTRTASAAAATAPSAEILIDGQRKLRARPCPQAHDVQEHAGRRRGAPAAARTVPAGHADGRLREVLGEDERDAPRSTRDSVTKIAAHPPTNAIAGPYASPMKHEEPAVRRHARGALRRSRTPPQRGHDGAQIKARRPPGSTGPLPRSQPGRRRCRIPG